MKNLLLRYLNIDYDSFNKIKAIDLLDKSIFSIVSAVIIFIVGFNFFIGTIDQSYTDDQYKILIGAFGLSATLSGLLFRGRNSTEDLFKQKIFYRIGESFLHATILFIFATIFKFCISQLKDVQSDWIDCIIIPPFKILAATSFLCGLLRFVLPLCLLNFILIHYKDDKLGAVKEA